MEYHHLNEFIYIFCPKVEKRSFFMDETLIKFNRNGTGEWT